jgi:hypothetical protein
LLNASLYISKFFLQKLKSVWVKAILLIPTIQPAILVVLVELTIGRASHSSEVIKQTCDEHSLANGVGNWLEEIPANPIDLVNAVE